MGVDTIGRRQLLQGAVAAGLMSGFGKPGVRGANDRVNLAFIGPGWHAQAAQIAGFHIVAGCGLNSKSEDFAGILADRSIDAVCIAAPATRQAQFVIQACQSGKDVYVETPVFANLEDGPLMVKAARNFHRVVQTGRVLRSGLVFHRVREVVGSGELGDIAFCRVAGARDPLPLIDLLQFLFDEAVPESLDAQSSPGSIGITFRYPGFIASYESRPGAWSISIHGIKGTLAVNRGGYSLFPHDGKRPSVELQSDPLQVPHWRNFLDCIRTRRKPAGDIEGCVRSTATCLRAGFAAG